MMTLRSFCVNAFALIVFLSAQAGADDRVRMVAVKGYDPVALLRGQEVEGDPNVFVERGRFVYRFRTEENKNMFLKEAADFEIQLGGACGSMGILSGTGNPNRYFVHKSKIYIFASDGCLRKFQNSPENCLDVAEAKPTGTPEQIRAGRILAAQAVEGFGGKSALENVKSLKITTKHNYKSKNGDYIGEMIDSIQFPDQFRQDQVWKNSTYTDCLSGSDGYRSETSAGKTEQFDMESCEQEYLRRWYHRFPIVALKEAAGNPEFSALAQGTERIHGVEAKFLVVHLHGGLTTFAIDPATNRVIRSSYRGRWSHGNPIGNVVNTYSDFRTINGVVIPYKVQTTVNGKPVTSPVVTLETIEINPNFAPKHFSKPRD